MRNLSKNCKSVQNSANVDWKVKIEFQEWILFKTVRIVLAVSLFTLLFRFRRNHIIVYNFLRRLDEFAVHALVRLLH